MSTRSWISRGELWQNTTVISRHLSRYWRKTTTRVKWVVTAQVYWRSKHGTFRTTQSEHTIYWGTAGGRRIWAKVESLLDVGIRTMTFPLFQGICYVILSVHRDYRQRHYETYHLNLRPCTYVGICTYLSRPIVLIEGGNGNIFPWSPPTILSFCTIDACHILWCAQFVPSRTYWIVPVRKIDPAIIDRLPYPMN